MRPTASGLRFGRSGLDRVGDLEERTWRSLWWKGEPGPTPELQLIHITRASLWRVVCSLTAQDDMQRRIIWEGNKRIIDDNNQRFFMGIRPFTMAMNKYGDLVRTSVPLHATSALSHISISKCKKAVSLSSWKSEHVKTANLKRNSNANQLLCCTVFVLKHPSKWKRHTSRIQQYNSGQWMFFFNCFLCQLTP